MANIHRLILLFFLSVCYPIAVFAQSAPVGAIDLAGWIKGTDGTFSRAFADGAGTRATPTNTTVNSTSTALVQTSKGLQSFDIQKTATVDVNRIGSAVGRFAKRVGPVAMALATAELICDLASICNQGGSWFTTQVQTLPPGDSAGWTCSHATSQAGTIDWCKANYYGCNSPTRLCSEDAVIDGGLGYKFKISERATGFVNGYADLHRPVAWVPAPTGATTATTDADWTSKETQLNDSRFTPKLAEENEDVPTGVPTLTPDQKKQLGLDSVPTKDSSGNITGREDTSTEIEAVDAGTRPLQQYPSVRAANCRTLWHWPGTWHDCRCHYFQSNFHAHVKTRSDTQMTIIVLTATPGCGKTNHAVWSYIKPAVEEQGRVVYVCGIPDLKLPHIKLSIAKLNTWAERTPLDPEEPEGKQKLNNILEGSLIVVDEAMYPWPAVDLKDPPEYIKYLSQHRKHGLDFLVITQSPKFVHPHVLENADRHIHLSQEWSGDKSYEWPEFCANPKLKTNKQNAVKKPYRLIKKAFSLYYSASLHVQKPKRAVPKMVYAAIFLLFAVPAMAMFTYGRVTEHLDSTTASDEPEKQP